MDENRVLDAILAAQKSAALDHMPEENIVKGMLGTATRTANLPGKVYRGEIDPLSDEGIQGAFDVATLGFGGGIGRAALSKATAGQELGIFAGPRAKNAPIKALHDAFDMKQRGALADDIWRQTGWNELPDKKWMWEISDDLMQLHPNPEGKPGYLKDRVSHGELTNAYPDMERTVVTRDSPYGQGYSLPPRDPHQGMVSIGPETDTDSARSVLLHELQHQLQAREGWIGGSNHGRTQNAMRKALEEGGSSIPYSQMNSAISDPSLVHRLYERDLGEMMARATQNRQDLTPLERRLRPPRLDFDMGIENAIVPRE